MFAVQQKNLEKTDSYFDGAFKSLRASEIGAIFQKQKNIHAVCSQQEIKGKFSSKGFLAGIALWTGAFATSALTYLHQGLGHGLLGYGLTSRDHTLYYHNMGSEQFHEMLHSHSFLGFLRNIGDWLGYAIASNFSGSVHGSPSPQNHTSVAIGTRAQDSWISISGHLPSLIVDSFSVIAGMHLRKKTPFLGNMLLGFGLLDSSLNSISAVQAACMSNHELEVTSVEGQDFAGFAVNMSYVTGTPAHTIALATAACWTGFVPIVALIAYFHSKSQIKDIVPDIQAIKHWVEKAQEDPKVAEELQSYYESYRYKELLEKIPVHEWYRSKVFMHFLEYLLEKVPTRTLNNCKKEILKTWEKNIVPDRVQTALTTASVLAIAVAVTGKVLQFLSVMGTPSLATAATAMGSIAPIFMGVTILSSGYQAYKDCQSSDEVIPQKAKMASVASLVIAIASTVLVIAAFCTPGFNLALLAAVIAGCLLQIFCNYFRSQVIHKQFALTQALSPEVWNVMYPLWKEHQKEGTPMGIALTKWARLVSAKVDLFSVEKALISDVPPSLLQMKNCRVIFS